jgi:hypothetical protein
MSKTSSDDLFQLIHSLTKSEKRHFKIFASRISSEEGKKFIRLFDLIHAQKVFDEDKLLKKDPRLSAQQIPNLKAHLYRQILLSVKLCNTSANVDVEIRNLIDCAQLLYNKCLYRQCIRMLDKAKKLAVENDRETLHLDVLELEKTVLNQTISANNEHRVAAVVKETRAVARSIRNIHIFSNLSLRLNSFYVRMGFIRNQRDLEKAEAVFIKYMPVYDEAKLSFYEKSYLYCCYTQYYYFIQDFQRVHDYAKKWVDLFLVAPGKIGNNLEMYIRSMNYLLMAQNKLMLYEEFSASLKKLVALKRSKSLNLTENINLVLFRTIYVHEINRHFMIGEFKSGTRIVAKLEPELNAFIPKLDTHYVLIFYYKIACLYFGAGEYKRAIYWLNKIINRGADDLRLDISSFARILSLISHYELENFDLLDYQIKSTYRFLIKHGNLGLYQKIILAFIKKLAQDMDEASLKQEFIRLKSALLALKQNQFNSKAFVYFDIISWLESKIESRPVQEVIKEKVKNKLLNANLVEL